MSEEHGRREVRDGVWRDRWSGDRFIVESTDAERGTVHGKREFQGNGVFEWWSARTPNFLSCYVFDREATAAEDRRLRLVEGGQDDREAAA